MGFLIGERSSSSASLFGDVVLNIVLIGAAVFALSEIAAGTVAVSFAIPSVPSVTDVFSAVASIIVVAIASCDSVVVMVVVVGTSVLNGSVVVVSSTCSPLFVFFDVGLEGFT